MEPREIAWARNSSFGALMRLSSVRIKASSQKERYRFASGENAKTRCFFDSWEAADGSPPAARREGSIAAQRRRKLVETRPKTLLGDKGYDSDAIRERVCHHGTNAVIPSESNRKVQRPGDPMLHVLRIRIERFLNTPKRNARRRAVRQETVDSFLAFIKLASIKI